jgi:hypothetical protein
VNSTEVSDDKGCWHCCPRAPTSSARGATAAGAKSTTAATILRSAGPILPFPTASAADRRQAATTLRFAEPRQRRRNAPTNRARDRVTVPAASGPSAPAGTAGRPSPAAPG